MILLINFPSARFQLLFTLRIFLMTWLVSGGTTPLQAQRTAGIEKDSPGDLSLAAFCRQNPSVVAAFFERINLDYPGLTRVKKAVNQKNWPAACNELLGNYQTNGSNAHLRDCVGNSNPLAKAEA
ncbi:MAG: hypothetical protein H7Z72_25230, partial [Bacteroidetes bacterium]|nr:hypothetical protein [Fibrella sp.]